HRRLLRSRQQLDPGVLSAVSALPRGRHAQVRLSARPGYAASLRWCGAGFPGAVQSVRHSRHGAGVLAELNRRALSGFREPIGLSGGVAEGPEAAEPGLDAE